MTDWISQCMGPLVDLLLKRLNVITERYIKILSVPSWQKYLSLLFIIWIDLSETAKLWATNNITLSDFILLNLCVETVIFLPIRHIIFQILIQLIRDRRTQDPFVSVNMAKDELASLAAWRGRNDTRLNVASRK